MSEINKFSAIEIRAGSQIPSSLQDECFKFWHQVWTDSYKFFGWTESVYSDQWTRQDSVLVLLANGRPIGSVFFKVHDLTRPQPALDSYFRMWPDELLNKVAEWPESKRCLVCSWFTLHADWRKQKQGVDAKFLLAGIAVEKFRASAEPMMVGTMVTKSNMHQLVYDAGAKTLLAGVQEKNLEVDLVYWLQTEMRGFEYPRLDSSIRQVWESTKNLNDPANIEGESVLRRAS